MSKTTGNAVRRYRYQFSDQTFTSSATSGVFVAYCSVQQQIKFDSDDTGINLEESMSWSIQTLLIAADQAIKQNNPGMVSACIRQLD